MPRTRRSKWNDYAAEKDLDRRRATIRLHADEWRDVATLQGDRNLSETLRALIAAGIATTLADQREPVA